MTRSPRAQSPDGLKPASPGRRRLLGAGAAALVGVAFPLVGCDRRSESSAVNGSAAPAVLGQHTDTLQGAWVVVRSDNTVVLRIPQAEIGQGTFTGLSQILADELDVAWTDIQPEFWDPSYNLAHDNVYVWTATLGSQGIASLYEPARQAAAQIRMRLTRAAAGRWGVPVDSVEARSGRLHHAASQRSLSYADVAVEAAKLPDPDPKTVVLKRPEQFRYIGQSTRRLDLPGKVDGSAVYGIDLKFPGMKFAAIRQSPVFGGKLVSFDKTAVAGRPGIIDVVAVRGGKSGINDATPGWGLDFGMDDAVAVVADDWWTAKTALEALPIVWKEGAAASVDSAGLEHRFLATLNAPLPMDHKPSRSDGDVAEALKRAVKVLQADYWVPFTEHAVMEPLNATARVDDQGVEVWAGTQFGDEALRIAAHWAEVPLGKAKMHVLLSGGGFGRRINSDFVAQAVQIARALKGTPVKLLWSREETTRHSYYPPLTVTRLKAGLDAQGKLVGWISRSVGGRAADQTYGTARIVQNIPAVHVDYQQIETPPPFGWKRGVGWAQHTWMNQSFLDELAQAAKRDPVEFQLALLRPEDVPVNMEKREFQVARVSKQRAVLEEVARRSQWSAPRKRGHGKGVAVHDMAYWPEYVSTAAAAVTEVTLGRDGLRVVKVTVVLDCGRVVNPDAAKAQIEGGVAFALTDALYSEITLAKGSVVQSNFHDYPLLPLREMPEVDVHFLPSEHEPHGVGEYAVPLLIASLVNAIHAAGGPRLRRLPIARQLTRS
jgi:isoquinoline 1-oxidoreductase beta subunit